MRFRLSLIGLLAVVGTSAVADAGATTLPEPPAQPGECWVPVLVPAQLARSVERIEIAPARERIERIPARYEWVEKTVTIPAGTRRVVVRPAEYATTEERVQVHPADEVQRGIPARTRSEPHRVVAATGPVLKPNPATGALCVVEGPTAWREEARSVVTEPAKTVWVERPAQFRTVRHRSLVKPAETTLKAVPARTVRRRERVLVEPAGEHRVAVPAVFGEQAREVQQTPARTEWRAVLCGDNAGRERVAAIQQALRAKGFDPGRTDGRFVDTTAAAMRAFEQDAGLPADGFSTAGLRQLGLSTP